MDDWEAMDVDEIKLPGQVGDGLRVPFCARPGGLRLQSLPLPGADVVPLDGACGAGRTAWMRRGAQRHGSWPGVWDLSRDKRGPGCRWPVGCCSRPAGNVGAILRACYNMDSNHSPARTQPCCCSTDSLHHSLPCIPIRLASRRPTARKRRSRPHRQQRQRPPRKRKGAKRRRGRRRRRRASRKRCALPAGLRALLPGITLPRAPGRAAPACACLARLLGPQAQEPSCSAANSGSSKSDSCPPLVLCTS